MITIGTVTGVYGLRGMIKVRPAGAFPERFQGLKKVFLKTARAPAAAFVVRSVKLAGSAVHLALEGINSPEEARRYQAAWLQLPDDEAFPLPEGYYYHHQLIGLVVYDGNRELGVLKDVLETGANDVYVVQGAGKDYLLPAVAQVIKHVDLDGGRLYVDMLPGLEDI
jgi:16S rRNA processing protein RimM